MNDAVQSETVELCVKGAEAEFQRRLDDARAMYARAWDAATDDYDRCVAAHYIAHLSIDDGERHRWNERALEHALRCDEARVAVFWGSLYVNLGHSHELLGDGDRAAHFYALAAEHGIVR